MNTPETHRKRIAEQDANTPAEMLGVMSPETAQGKAQHSPLPWQTDFAIEAAFDDGGRKETVIEIMTDDHGDTPCYATSKANARLIVASVNHAGKLAEAGERLKNAVSDLINEPRTLEIEHYAETALQDWQKTLSAYEAAQS